MCTSHPPPLQATAAATTLWHPKDPKHEPIEWWIKEVQAFADRTLQYPRVFQSIPEETDRMAVIIEPRRHPLLGPVLRNFMFYLAPRGWGLLIFHGTDNALYVREVTAGWSHVHFRQLDIEEETKEVAYSKLLTDKDLWTSIPAEHVLVFQTDCFLRDDAIERWMAYDYVGAPWSNWVERRLRDKVGNGGLSLRKRSAILRCLEEHQWDGKTNEDIYYSLDCGFSKPSLQEAVEFVSETIFDENRPPMGFHHAWQYIEYDKDPEKNQLLKAVRDYNQKPFLKDGSAEETKSRVRRRGSAVA